MTLPNQSRLTGPKRIRTLSTWELYRSDLLGHLGHFLPPSLFLTLWLHSLRIDGHARPLTATSFNPIPIAFRRHRRVLNVRLDLNNVPIVDIMIRSYKQRTRKGSYCEFRNLGIGELLAFHELILRHVGWEELKGGKSGKRRSIYDNR